jgi:hypothetical protein
VVDELGHALREPVHKGVLRGGEVCGGLLVDLHQCPVVDGEGRVWVDERHRVHVDGEVGGAAGPEQPATAFDFQTNCDPFPNLTWLIIGNKSSHVLETL